MFHHVEYRVVRPFRVAEALVAFFRFDNWRSRLAWAEASDGIAPKFHIAGEKLGLGPHNAVGLSRQGSHNLCHGGTDVERVDIQCRWSVGGAQGGLSYRALSGHGSAGQVSREGFEGLALLGGDQLQDIRRCLGRRGRGRVRSLVRRLGNLSGGFFGGRLPPGLALGRFAIPLGCSGHVVLLLPPKRLMT